MFQAQAKGRPLALHQIVTDGEIDGDPGSSIVELEGIKGFVAAKIPASFFAGMFEMTTGEGLGIIAIKSSTGTDSEVSNL